MAKKPVRLKDVREAEQAWCSAVSAYGENNMATDRAEWRYRELNKQWLAQKHPRSTPDATPNN